MTAPLLDDPPLYPPTVRSPEQPLPLLRYLARFIRNPIAAFPRQVFEEPLVAYGRRRSFVVWVTDPALIETILLEQAELYPKTPLDKRILKHLLGEGILTSDNEDWRWQRKVAAPLFRHAEILANVPEMAACAERQLQRWRDLGGLRRRDVEDDMTDLTFDVISSTVLAGCGPDEGHIIKVAGEEFLAPITWDIAAAMLRLPEWVWHPGKRRMRRAAEAERSAVHRILERRRKANDGGGDILARLMLARHPETGAPMPDERIVDNLATFLAAGHDTTAKALTWTLYLLARAPEWQRLVREEVAAVCGSRPIASADLEHLKITERVIKEALRLYPPAPVMARFTAQDVVLGGKSLKAQTLIIIPIFAVHRHHAVWIDPDRFDPNRFLPAKESKIRRTQFMPFGYGARTCIGSSFAMIEAVTLLATLIRGAEFGWDGRHEPEPISRVTLRPNGGMPLLVKPL